MLRVDVNSSVLFDFQVLLVYPGSSNAMEDDDHFFISSLVGKRKKGNLL